MIEGYPDVLPANLTMAEEFAASMRQIDKEECLAGGLTPLQAVRSSLCYSDKAFIWLTDGKPACMFGVGNPQAFSNVGIPWLFSTEEVKRNKFRFLRCYHPFLESMLAMYNRLENYVDTRQKETITWLKWMGFSVEDNPVPYGPLQMPFHHFMMER